MKTVNLEVIGGTGNSIKVKMKGHSRTILVPLAMVANHTKNQVTFKTSKDAYQIMKMF